MEIQRRGITIYIKDQSLIVSNNLQSICYHSYNATNRASFNHLKRQLVEDEYFWRKSINPMADVICLASKLKVRSFGIARPRPVNKIIF